MISSILSDIQYKHLDTDKNKKFSRILRNHDHKYKSVFAQIQIFGLKNFVVAC